MSACHYLFVVDRNQAANIIFREYEITMDDAWILLAMINDLAQTSNFQLHFVLMRIE